MAGVVADGLHRTQVKALHVQQRGKITFLQHLYQVAGDAAQAEAALDAQPLHDGLQVLGDRQRGAAGACLEGETVLEQA